MENLEKFWEIYISPALNIISLYFKDNIYSLSLTFFIIIAVSYIALYWVEYDRKKSLECYIDKLQNLLSDREQTISKQIQDQKNIKNKYKEIINRITTQSIYYKRKYIAYRLSIITNFWVSKPVMDLIKNDYDSFMKKKTKELVKLYEKK